MINESYCDVVQCSKIYYDIDLFYDPKVMNLLSS